LLFLLSQKKRKIAIMLGELCTDISNRLGTFVESFGILEEQEKNSSAQGAGRKRQRKAAGVEVEDEDELYSDHNAHSDSEEVSAEDDDDDEENDDDDEGNDDDSERNDHDAEFNDDDGVSGDMNPGNSSVRGEYQNGRYLDIVLQQLPRRSPRLTPKKPHDGPSSNLRDRRCNNDSPVNNSNDMSVQGLIQSTRRKAEKDHKARLQAAQRNEKGDAPEISGWSPFSELRKLVGSEPRHEIDLPFIEPTFIDDDGKAYAEAVFKDVSRGEMHLSPGSRPPLNEFGNEDVIQKMTMECFELVKLDIRDDKQQQRVSENKGNEKKEQTTMKQK
jgi:hypothetical protein